MARGFVAFPKSFDDLLSRLPTSAQADLNRLVDEEAASLMKAEKVRWSRKRALHWQNIARLYILDDIHDWFAGAKQLTPENVLAHRKRFVDTWAITQLLLEGDPHAI